MSDTYAIGWLAVPTLWLGAVALVALGWIALGRICSSRERNACQAALVLCTLGMSIGLAIDAHEGRLAMLDALCRSGERNPVYWLQLHWRQLPAMHGGMLTGNLLTLLLPLSHAGAAYRSLPRRLLCGVFMLAGMSLGALAHVLVGNETTGPSIMTALMIAGMTWGTVLGIVTLEYRSDPPHAYGGIIGASRQST